MTFSIWVIALSIPAALDFCWTPPANLPLMKRLASYAGLLELGRNSSALRVSLFLAL